MSALSQTEFDHETFKLTRSIFDTSPDHISIVRTDYRYRRVNPAYERAHGIVQDNIIGLHVADLLGEEVFKNVIKPKLDRCMTGEEIEYESWITFKQYGQRYMNIRYIPLKSDGGKIEAVVVQSRDLTHQKEATAARATLEYAADHAQEGLALHDTDGIFTYINPAQAQMYGYEVEELLGKPWKELYGAEQGSEIETNHFPVLMRDGKWKGELKGKKKNGEQFDVHVALTLLKSAKGEPEGLLCSCRDITEEKRTEQTLRDNEAQFRDLYESAPVAYLSVSLDGHLTRLNTKAEELLGYSRQSLLGTSVLSLYAPTENGQTKAIQLEKQAQSGTEILGEELEMQRADGSIIWISMTVRLIRDEKGNIIERRGAVQDISQRKQQEQELNQKQQRLQLVNQIMTDLQAESSMGVIIQQTLKHVSKCFPQFRVAYATLSDSKFLMVEQSIEPDDMPPLTGAKANLSIAPEYLKTLLKKEAYIATDIDVDERLAPLLEQLKASQTRALLDLPLTLSHNVVGLLCFDSPRAYEWTSHELDTLKEIADFLTLALKNAQEQQRRQHAELQLQTSEQRYRSIVESAPFCIHEIDLNGRVTSMNPAGQKMIGVNSEAEVLHRSYLDLAAPHDGERMKMYFSQACQGEIVEFDFQVEKNTNVKYYQKTFAPVQNSKGEITTVLGIVEDITERKHAEERLIQSENQHRLVTENVPALIAKFDRDCRYQFVNQHYQQRFGLTKDQMIGKHASDILGPQAYEQVKPNMEKTLAGAQVTYEVKVPTETKDLRWVKATYVPDRTQSSGPIDGFYALIEDIHDHKTANENLQKSEKQYRSLIETAGSVIIGLSPDHRVVEWNREAERLYGWSRQEMLGKNYVKFFVPEADQPTVEADIKNVLAGHPTRDFENPIRTRDGQTRELLWNVDRLLDEHQNPTGIIAIGRDITERKQAAEELKKAHQQLAEQKEHLARLNDSFVQALGEITYDYNIVTDHIQWGGAYRRILGYTPEGMGNNFESWLSRIYPDDVQLVEEEFEQATNSKSFFELEYRFKRRDGSYAWMHDRGVIHRNETGQVEKVIGIMRDITNRKKEEEFRERQTSILELITRGMSLPTILKEICLACESQCEGILSSILLLDGDRLRHGAGPSLPAPYNQAVDGILIGPTAGSCGTAVYRKDLVIVRDIENDPLWEQGKRLALRHNLRACWSMPILSSSESILGTFAMYYHDPHHPTEQELDILQVFNHLGGIAIERNKAEEELQRAHDDLEERVQVRTIELSQANSRLLEEIAERQRAEKQFVNIVKGVAGTTGEKFFPSFVEQLAVALEVDYAFVGQLIEKNEPTVSTMAVYGDGTFLDNFEYGLNHTPCKNVATRQKFCSFPKEVNQLFPKDRLLDELGIEAYAGVPLLDTDGKVFGLMVVLKKEPMTKLHMVESTMKIFAARAAAELERQRAEVALKQSEALAREQLAELNMIYNSAPIGLCLVDKDLRYVRINDTLSQMNGVPAADHIGKRFKDVLPDVGHHSNSIAKNIFQTAQPALGVEFQGVTPAHPGQQRHWLANYYPIIDDGEVKAIGGVVQDITERKQREALLQTIHQAESEFIASEDPSKIFDRLLANVLKISNSGYGFIGEALRTEKGELYLKTHAITNIAWNQETRELYERSALNLEFYKLNPLFGEVLNTGQPVIANDPYTDHRRGGHPEGHPPLHAFLGLPFFQGDRLVGMVGVANRSGGYDKQLIEFLQPLLTSCGTLINAFQIEQRRSQTEQALQESEARLQAILDNSPGLIFLKDLNGRYLHVNRQFKNMLDLRDQEVIGKTDDEVFSADQASQFKTHDHQVMESQKLLEFEEVAMHADGPHTSIVHKFPLLNEKNEIFAIGGITTDITIRKQAEKSLQESEERFRKIFEEGPLGMALVGLDYRFLKVNATLCRMVRYTEQELTSRTFADITHPEDLEKDLELAQQLFKGNIPSYTLEKRYLKKNREEFWINLTASVIRDQDGVPLYGLAMIEDITDRKRIEQTLKNRMETIHDLYNNAPCGYHSLDAEGRYIEVNDTELKWLGYSREEMIGKLRVTDITTPASQRQFHEVYADFKEQGNASSLQAEYIKKDGTILNGLVSAVAVRDDQGQFLKSRTSVLDISALKEAEEALTESHLRFQRIFDEAGIGIVLVDITGHVVESNPAFQHFLGYSLDELKRMAFPEFIHPEDTPNCLEHYGKLVEGACQSYDLEERYVRKDGSVVWGHLTVTLLRNRQKNRYMPLPWLKTLRNGSELKKT